MQTLLLLCLFAQVLHENDPIMLGMATETNVQNKEVKVLGKMLVEGEPFENRPLTLVTFQVNQETTFYNLDREKPDQKKDTLQELYELTKNNKKTLVYVFCKPSQAKGGKPPASAILYKQIEDGTTKK